MIEEVGKKITHRFSEKNVRVKTRLIVLCTDSRRDLGGRGVMKKEEGRDRYAAGGRAGVK